MDVLDLIDSVLEEIPEEGYEPHEVEELCLRLTRAERMGLSLSRYSEKDEKDKQ